MNSRLACTLHSCLHTALQGILAPKEHVMEKSGTLNFRQCCIRLAGQCALCD